jgi:hypothetical protein
MKPEKLYAKYLHDNGYCYIAGQYYKALCMKNDITDNEFLVELASLRHGFFELCIDPYSSGNRYRSYIQCRADSLDSFTFGHFVDYMQTEAYNPDTGGLVRNYPSISSDVLNNKILNILLLNDMVTVNEYKSIGKINELNISIHLFRYKAMPFSPAYSSPLWLHKDDEDIVFVHLIAISSNMIGGDSLIASNMKNIDRVLRLENTFDTLVVNHDKFHAVTPIGCRIDCESKASTRDVVLVTFQKWSHR